MTSDRAGQPAEAADLVDVAKLVTAYFAVHPDPGEAAQRVSFGTSGHRGSAFTATFNEDHIAATTQAICEYRAAAGHQGPAVPGRRHPRAVRARAGHRAGGARRQWRPRAVRRPRRIHADPGGVPGDPGTQRARLGPPRRRDRGHPVAQPAHGRRLQVQPAGRRPGRYRHHPVDPGPGQRTARQRPGRRSADPLRAGGRGRHHRAVRLPRRLCVRARPGRRPGRGQGGRDAHRRGPARRGQRRLLGRDRRALRPGPDGRQPGRGRQVPAS